MPDQSVVEELLEKGARAVGASMRIRKGPHEIAEAAFDAVFPGWREYAPLLAAVATGEGITRTREPKLFGEQLRIRQITTIRGPWVPVEEGTDG